MSVLEGEPFVLEGTLDATNVVSEKGYATSIKSTKKSNEMTLILGENGIDIAAGSALDAFFTIHPVDLTDKVVTIKVFDAEGNELSSETFAGRAIPRNAFIKFTENSQKPVASIDGVEYATVNAAINAITLGGNFTKTISLLDDVKENIFVNDTRRNYRGQFYTIIFDMKGHSITAETGNAITIKSGELSIKNGTINSTNRNGVIFDPQADSARVTLWGCNVTAQESAIATSTASNCSVTITGGTYTSLDNAVISGNGSVNHKMVVDGETTDTGVVREKANSITINSNSTYGVPVFNGKIQTEGYVACGIYAPWKDIITINAGKFNIENDVGILSRGGTVTINDVEIVTTEPSEGYKGKVGDSRVVVPCKTVFIDTECNYPALPNASITIMSGKYSDNAGAGYVQKGYSYAETGVSPLAYEVVTSETKLIQDINNVVENGTVLVEDNVSLKSEPIVIKKDFNLVLAESAGITATYSKYENVLNFCHEGGNNTISGSGTITCHTASPSAAVQINAKNQTLTIDGNVTIKGGESTDDKDDIASAVTICNGKLVINNGTFISGTDATGNNSPAIYLRPNVGETAVLEINGGVFKSVSGNAEFLINRADDAKSRCTVIIKGGTFYGFNPADNSADGEHTNYVADGYTVKYDAATDAYTVVEGTSSAISSQEDLNNAITGAAKGEAVTITLPSNSTFTLDNGIAHEGTKSRIITFEGNGTQTVDVVSNAITAEGGELNYQRGSSFTFRNLTIQAGVGAYDGIVCDELTYEKCTIKGKLTLYGKATFIDCTFENDMDDQYSIWTWGGTDVKFEGCTFNSTKKSKAILLYGENRTTNLTVSGCTFNNTKGDKTKAAIEIHTEKGLSGTLNISGTKIVSGFNGLWWEGNNAANPKYDTKKFTIIIDGEIVQTAE